MMCSCGNPMAKEHDRYRCYICGFSVWHHFQLRQPIVRDVKGHNKHSRKAIKGYGKEPVNPPLSAKSASSAFH